MRLIDANELKHKITEMYEVYNDPYEHYDNGFQDAVSQIDDFVDSLTTVDLVKYGEWKLDRSRGVICCTNCGGEKPLRYCDGGTFHTQSFPSPYCPYCGADMRGDRHEQS